MPSVTTTARRAVADRLGQGAFELGHVVVAVDRLRLGPGQAHGVDDAVVVQLVADHHGLVRDQVRQHPHDGGVGRAVGHGGLAAVEGGQAPLELHVGAVGAADEAHRAGAGAVARGRLLLGLHHLGAQPHPQVAVGVHLDERLVAVAVQEEAGAPVALGGEHAGDDVLRALEGAFGLQLVQVIAQGSVDAVERHGGSPSRCCSRMWLRGGVGPIGRGQAGASAGAGASSPGSPACPRSWPPGRSRAPAPLRARRAVVQRVRPGVGDALAHRVDLVVDGEVRPVDAGSPRRAPPA